MIFRGLDANADWQFGQGINSYTTGNAAIALNIKTALRTFYGDAFWNGQFGIDWIHLLGTPGTQNAILAQTRAIIAQCKGVTGITSVNTSFNAIKRTLTLNYTVSTVYSVNVPGSAQILV